MRQSLFLDENLLEGLKQLKLRDGIPQAEAVRRAVAGYLVSKGIKVEEPAAAKKAESIRKR